jgi:hypothetical protein
MTATGAGAFRAAERSVRSQPAAILAWGAPEATRESLSSEVTKSDSLQVRLEMTDPNSTSRGPSFKNTVWLQSLSRGLWSKAATILAVIGLVDLTHQLIEWASIIHQIAMKYAEVRELLFAWVPFHIPQKWHDPIILAGILLSVINVGFYRSTGEFYFSALINTSLVFVGKDKFRDRTPDRLTNNIDFWIYNFSLLGAFIFFMLGWIAMILSIVVGFIWIDEPITHNPLLYVMAISILLFLFLVVGSLLAWRWIIVTALLFVGLFAVNEVYVSWLK